MEDMPISDIGGGYVRRHCSLGKPGDTLSAHQLTKMPASNRKALIRLGMIEIYPAQPVSELPDGVSRFVINRGFGKWDVIEGKLLNGSPLNKEQAHRMAGFLKPMLADLTDEPPHE